MLKLTGFFLIAALPVMAQVPPPGTNGAGKGDIAFAAGISATTNSEDCKPGDGLVLKLDAGSSITGPMTLTSIKGYSKAPDGTQYTDYEDDLSITAGNTVTGPMVICSRVRKP